jgi:hypothetical protein
MCGVGAEPCQNGQRDADESRSDALHRQPHGAAGGGRFLALDALSGLFPAEGAAASVLRIACRILARR